MAGLPVIALLQPRARIAADFSRQTVLQSVALTGSRRRPIDGLTALYPESNANEHAADHEGAALPGSAKQSDCKRQYRYAADRYDAAHDDATSVAATDIVERPGTTHIRAAEHALFCEDGAAALFHGPLPA